MYIKLNINTLDNVELKYNTIILLNNQTNERKWFIWGIPCLCQIEHIDFYNKLLNNFLLLLKKYKLKIK